MYSEVEVGQPIPHMISYMLMRQLNLNDWKYVVFVSFLLVSCILSFLKTRLWCKRREIWQDKVESKMLKLLSYRRLFAIGTSGTRLRISGFGFELWSKVSLQRALYMWQDSTCRRNRCKNTWLYNARKWDTWSYTLTYIQSKMWYYGMISSKQTRRITMTS